MESYYFIRYTHISAFIICHIKEFNWSYPILKLYVDKKSSAKYSVLPLSWPVVFNSETPLELFLITHQYLILRLSF